MRIDRRIVGAALVAILATACAMDAAPSAEPSLDETVKPRGTPPPAPLACGDLTEDKVAAWKGTIGISFTATDAQGDQVTGSASYTVRYSNDATMGHSIVRNWGPATEGWTGETQAGSGQYKSTFVPTSPGDPPKVDQGDGVLLPLSNFISGALPELDDVEIDPKGCRYLLSAGINMHLAGGTTAIGFGGNAPSMPIPTSSATLAGSYTVPIPNCATASNCNDDPVTGDRPAEFDFQWQGVSSGRSLSGSATFTWSLAPVFRGSLAIAGASLTDIDDQALGWISASPCDIPNCGGNPRVKGTISVSGDADDSLTNVTLDLVQGGTVVASETLVPTASATLPLAFGNDGTVTLPTQTLFELTPGEGAKIDQVSDARLTLRVHATSARGREATRDVAAVPKLVWFTGTNRYGPRDANRGGDSWIKPSVAPVLAGLGSTWLWSDISNMNGGTFYPPHKSHDRGNDADGRFADGSIERDWAALHHHTAATAQKLIAALSDPANGPRIACIGLLYAKNDDFEKAIRNVTLPDGRPASAVIRPWHGHDTHFHVRVSDAGDRTYSSCTPSLPDGVP